MRGWGGGQLGVTTVIPARAAPPPTRSLPIPTPTARVPGPGGNGAEPSRGEKRKAGIPGAGRARESRSPYDRSGPFTPGSRRPPAPAPRSGRPSHPSARLDQSLTVPVHTNQALWVVGWSSFPPFRTPFSPRSPLPAATGIQRHSFSRQNLMASCCRKSAHLCRKAGRRALSYPGLCRDCRAGVPPNSGWSSDVAVVRHGLMRFGIDDCFGEN